MSTPSTDLTGRVALSPAELADALGVSRMHVYNMMTRGDLQSFHVGRSRRIPVSEIDRLIGEESTGTAS